MTEQLLYIIAAFVLGFVLAWILRSTTVLKHKKVLKSTEGFLESERLKKDTLKNENLTVHRQKQTFEMEMEKKLKEAHAVIKRLDDDILLLQKSNEETEDLLKAGNPEIHELKLKLIEANNTIARQKASTK